MSKKLSLVGVDLGGINTGVYFANLDPAGEDLKLTAPEGHVFRTTATGIQFSQAERTKFRHMRRNYKRRKLAKRLLRIIITTQLGVDTKKKNERNKNQTTWQFMSGLLNRRGFTFNNETKGEKLNSVPLKQVSTLIGYEFNHNQPLELQLRSITSDRTNTSKLLLNETFTKKKKELKQAIDPNNNTDKETVERIADQILAIKENLQNAIDEFDKGGRHRTKYFQEIQHDIDQFIRNNPSALKGYSAEQLTNLVGNISNLQLRPLRRYFNDISYKNGKASYDDNKIQNIFLREVKGWHPKTDEERRSRKELLRLLSTEAEFWTKLLELNPSTTIPFYEDQNNRRPPKCRSLLLNSQQLDKKFSGWRGIVSKLTKNENSNLTFRDDSDKRSLCDARTLQRILDRSNSIDPIRLRQLAKRNAQSKLSNINDQAIATLDALLDPNSKRILLDIAGRYYDETKKAKDGLWESTENSLLAVCDSSTRHKHREKHHHLSGLLKTTITPERLDEFVNKFWVQRPTGSRSTIKGIAETCSELVRKKGRNLKELYWDLIAEKNTKDDIVKAFSQASLALYHIMEGFSRSELSKPDPLQDSSSLYILAQIYEILEKNQSGFSKTCHLCTLDNSSRSTTEERNGWRKTPEAVEWEALPEKTALCSRLPADSIRPFDGFLARMLDRLAHDAASEKLSHLRKSDSHGEHEILLMIEENYFDFAESLLELKPKPENIGKRNERKEKSENLRETKVAEDNAFESKIDRIKNASNDVCPYNGTSIGNNGQIDHIIPQALTRKIFGYSFNSEANLIYSSVSGNREKGNTLYTLGDLDFKYLENQFQTTDTAKIEEFIVKTISQIRKKNAEFRMLTNEQQKAIRHSLFIDGEIRQKALRAINKHYANRVNGTQMWFARRFAHHIIRQTKGGDHSISVTRAGADTQTTALLRMELSREYPEYKKNEQQAPASHCIDACLAALQAFNTVKNLHNQKIAATGSSKADMLKNLMPKEIMIHTVTRRSTDKKIRRADFTSSSFFNSTIYAERYLPVLVDRQGKVYFGFTLKNAICVSDNARDSVFRISKPFLELGKNNLIKDKELSDIINQIGNRPYLCLNWNRTLLHEYLQKCQSERAVNKDLTDLISQIGFTTIRKEVINKLYNATSKQYNISIDENHFELKVKLKNTPEGRVVLPVRDSWLKLINNERLREFHNKSSNDKPLSEFRSLIADLFPHERDAALHKRKKQVFSLPVLQAPNSGTPFRIKRRHQNGDSCFQLACKDGLAVKGFPVNSQTGELVNKAVLLDALNAINSPNLCPKKDDYSNIAENIVSISEWRSVAVPEPLAAEFGITRIELCLATQGRGTVRIFQKFENFSKFYPEAFNSPNPDTWVNIKDSFKGEPATKGFGIDYMNKPRDGKVSITAFSPNTIVFEYTTSSSRSKKFNEVFMAGRPL